MSNCNKITDSILVGVKKAVNNITPPKNKDIQAGKVENKKSDYFIVKNLFSEIKTDAEKAKARFNLGIHLSEVDVQEIKKLLEENTDYAVVPIEEQHTMQLNKVSSGYKSDVVTLRPNELIYITLIVAPGINYGLVTPNLPYTIHNSDSMMEIRCYTNNTGQDFDFYITTSDEVIVNGESVGSVTMLEAPTYYLAKKASLEELKLYIISLIDDKASINIVDLKISSTLNHYTTLSYFRNEISEINSKIEELSQRLDLLEGSDMEFD